MQSKSKPAEWACKHAAEIVGAEYYAVEWVKPHTSFDKAMVSFARYIEEHEDEPVDPLLVEAREIVKATLTPERHKRCNCRQEIDAGKWDDGQKVRATLAGIKRGITLTKEPTP